MMVIDEESLNEKFPAGNTYYDMEGNPVGLGTWMKLFQDTEARIIAKDRVGDYVVSTVWVGIHHGVPGNVPPLIFETMVFPVGDLEDEYTRRYPTKEVALIGHQEAIQWARQQTDDEDLPLEDIT